jgi:hypothetical protein
MVVGRFVLERMSCHSVMECAARGGVLIRTNSENVFADESVYFLPYLFEKEQKMIVL